MNLNKESGENKMALFTEATLSDSFIYAAFNNNKVMSIRIAEVIKSGVSISPEQLEEQLLHLKRTRISPLMDIVIDAFNKGDIVLMHSDIINIPSSIPFVVMKDGGRFKAFVFTKRYGSLNKDGSAYSIQAKTMYVLMEAAYLAMVYYQHPERFKRSSGLVKVISNIYTLMIMRILNKDYALTIEPDLHSQIAYIVSRFFLDRVVELDNNIVSNSYSSINAKPSSAMVLNGISAEYDQRNIKNFEELIEYIASFNKRVSGLNKKMFIQTFMNTYGAVSVLGLDCLPYFMLTITSTLMGSFLVNETIMSDIIKNTRGLNANIIYPELTKIV